MTRAKPRATKAKRKKPAAAATIPPEVLEVPQGTRERVRVEVLRRQRAGEPITNRAVREACAPAGAGHVALLLRLVNAGDLDPRAAWVVHATPANPGRKPAGRRNTEDDQGDEEQAVGVDPEGLAREILGARSHEELQELCQRCAAEVARGRLEPRAANALTGLLTEARQNQVQVVRQQPEEPETERALLAGPEAYELLADFEAIVSEDRRAAVRAHVTAEAAQDRLEHPNRCSRDEP